MDLSLHISLRQHVTMRNLGGDALLIGGKRSLSLSKASPGVKAALARLAVGGGSEDELCDVAEAVNGIFMDRVLLAYWLLKLQDLGFLRYTLKAGAAALATIESTAHASLAPASLVAGTQKIVLSRFAYLRRVRGEGLLEIPFPRTQIVLHDNACAHAIVLLMEPRTRRELQTAVAPESQHAVGALIDVLYQLSIVCDADRDEPEAMRSWEFHDLLFHARTRMWADDEPVGATMRFGVHPPQSSDFPHRYSTGPMILPKPKLHALIANDRPFTDILECRRSLRDGGGPPISMEQLSEFLYRAARVRSGLNGTSPEADRPYPSAGACYELELYVLVRRCRGIGHGLYHYRPDVHGLRHIEADQRSLNHLIEDARAATGGADPHIVFIIAARFLRVSWKYEAIAYSLVLKNVGVLFQTMYLVATAMRLNPCAVGAGNARLFAKATGLDPLEEGSVGEFILSGAVSGAAPQV
jgi:SagB-type dehydrogenase family enzyme